MLVADVVKSIGRRAWRSDGLVPTQLECLFSTCDVSLSGDTKHVEDNVVWKALQIYNHCCRFSFRYSFSRFWGSFLYIQIHRSHIISLIIYWTHWTGLPLHLNCSLSLLPMFVTIFARLTLPGHHYRLVTNSKIYCFRSHALLPPPVLLGMCPASSCGDTAIVVSLALSSSSSSSSSNYSK